jgi:hypothetical protein
MSSQKRGSFLFFGSYNHDLDLTRNTRHLYLNLLRISIEEKY